MKFGETENSKECEEQKHRVEEDKSGYAQPADIFETVR